MTIENISRSISKKECCRPRRGSNPQPPVSSQTRIRTTEAGLICSLPSMLSISNSIAITINSVQINLLCCSIIIIIIITGYCIICNYMQEPNLYNRTKKLPKGCVTTAGGVQRMELNAQTKHC